MNPMPHPLVGLLIAGLGSSVAAQEPGPLTERERAVHALSRLSFGPRPDDVERVLAMGVEAWIEEQLAPTGPDEALEDRLAILETLDMTPRELRDSYLVDVGENPTLEQIRERGKMRRTPRRQLISAVVVRSLRSRWQLEEVMADFWRNHFNVSYTKGGPVDYLITDWEREVIRPHALGSFGDLLHASAKHPAMLFYLDNVVSRRPATERELERHERRVRRRTGSDEEAAAAVELAAQRGLNENYARELLELHTLGVDNFYDQADVVAVAEALTGWTVDAGREGSWEFRFRPGMHVQGSKRVLGKGFRAKPDEGPAEGEQILDHLAAHRGTAEFIATKLVQRFVNDEPPAKLVDEVAATFRKTDGDVAAMMRTLVDSEEFWSRENYRAKFKTPYEFIVSALRVTGAEISGLDRVLRYLQELGQPVYHCDPPTGYADTAESWLDPGVMAVRWQFAVDLAEGKLRGIRIPVSFYDDIPEDVPPRLWQHYLTKKILPGGAGERTRAALTQVTDQYLARKRHAPSPRDLGPQLVGLLLGSPEFQQQ